jgi:hypothetical protein
VVTTPEATRPLARDHATTQPPMSSFSNPHYMYLFDLKNGKKKLAYGQSPEDALAILSYRLSQEEMDEIIQDKFVKIHQRQLQEYVHLLG